MRIKINKQRGFMGLDKQKPTKFEISPEEHSDRLLYCDCCEESEAFWEIHNGYYYENSIGFILCPTCAKDKRNW